MRNLKIIGPAVLAMLALSGVFANAAQAELTFTLEDNLGTVSSSYFASQYLFSSLRPTPTAPGVACSGAGWNGSSATGKEKLLTASIANNVSCEYWIKYETHRSLNGCDYRFNLTKNLALDKYEGTTDIVCPKETGYIDYQATQVGGGATLCTIKVKAQTGVGPVYYEDITPAEGRNWITIKIQATNLKTITEAANPANCGLLKTGENVNGTLSEQFEVWGRSNFNEEIVHLVASG